MDEQFLSTLEYANQHGVSRRTVQRWIQDGRLDAVKVGHTYRIPTQTDQPSDPVSTNAEGFTPSTDREFLTTKQYAEAYGISVQETRDLIHEGKLTADKVRGKYHIYSDTNEKPDPYGPEIPDEIPDNDFPITDETVFDAKDLRQEYLTLEEVVKYAAKIPVPHKIIKNKRGLYRAVVLYGQPVTMEIQGDEMDDPQDEIWGEE